MSFYFVCLLGNVLLLKNHLTLSPDIAEVTQEKLLSLVAERLIDSNSNVDVSAFLICLFVTFGCIMNECGVKNECNRCCLFVFLFGEDWT